MLIKCARLGLVNCPHGLVDIFEILRLNQLFAPSTFQEQANEDKQFYNLTIYDSSSSTFELANIAKLSD